MSTATATPDPQQWTVTLTTDAAGPGRWMRATRTGRDVEVSDLQDTVDLIPPLNTDLYYYWQDPDGIVEAPIVRVDAAGPVLSSTVTGVALPVVVMDARPLRFDGGSVWHQVLGRPAGIVSILPAPYPSGRLRLYARDYAERVNLLSLLQANEPLALRSTCPGSVDDQVIVAQRWEDPPVSADDKAGPAWIDIDYQAVSAVPADYAPPAAWTWGDLEDMFETWGDVEDAYASWADLEAGPP